LKRRFCLIGACLIAECLLLVGGWPGLTASAWAQETAGQKQAVKQTAFDIPAQSLVNALTVFSVQSGIQFISANPRIAYVISRRISGVFSPAQALRRLLEGSGFSFEFTNPNTVRIFRRAGARPPAIVGAHNTTQRPLAAGAPADLFEEIIVTARKREENLMDIPIAVTVLSADNLEKRGVDKISDIADIVPNVTFSIGGTSSGSSSAAVVYIRGVGQNDFTPVTDPGVGIYVDGVYLGRTIGSVLDVMDLERIEVLRGPQGTLFGRNTIGGAISLITRDPGSTLAGRLKLTTGRYGRVDAFASLDLPVSDTLAATVSSLLRSRKGYVKRVLAGDRLGDDEALDGRAKIIWTPGHGLTFRLSIDGARERESSAPEVARDINEAATFIVAYNSNIFGNGAPAACIGGGPLTNPACANDQYAGQPFTSYETGPSRNDLDQWGVSLIARKEVSDWLTLKSITAYRKIKALFSRSSDGMPFAIFQTTDDYRQHQLTQEIQLIGNAFESRLNWVSGFFYMTEAASDIDLVEAIEPSFPRQIGGMTDNDNIAFFGEATYDATRRLHLTAGLRYTNETKRFLPVARVLADAAPYVPAIEKSLSFNEVTWRGALVYEALDEISGYLTVSKGFKSGGFVQRLTQPVDEPPSFRPEYVTLYEFGLKMAFPSARLRANLAFFYSDYNNIQVAANPPGRIDTVTANAANGTIKGIEAEFTWSPLAALRAEGALGYQDAAYNRIGDLGVAISLADRFIRTPKWSWSLGLSWRFALAGGASLTPRLDWIYKSAIQFEPVNNPFVAENGYHLVNVKLAYEDPGARWRLSVGVDNLTNAKYLLSGDSNDTIGYALAIFARPRNWFVSLDRSF